MKGDKSLRVHLIPGKSDHLLFVCLEVGILKSELIKSISEYNVGQAPLVDEQLLYLSINHYGENYHGAIVPRYHAFQVQVGKNNLQCGR